jgi:hypothetical protein
MAMAHPSDLILIERGLGLQTFCKRTGRNRSSDGVTDDPAWTVFEVVEGHHHHGSQAIFIGNGELFMRDGLQRCHCRTPGHGGAEQNLPLVAKVVSVFVHHRPVGAINQTDRLVVALDRDDGILGRMDTSYSWEMSTRCLQQMCTAVGLDYDVERYDYFPEMWAAHPKWVDAEVEFEVDHPKEEDAREVGMFVWYASALAVLLGGAYMIAFVRSPLGPWYRALAFAGLALAAVLTLWAKSKRRMRRSVERRSSGTSG